MIEWKKFHLELWWFNHKRTIVQMAQKLYMYNFFYISYIDKVGKARRIYANRGHCISMRKSKRIVLL